MKLHTDVPEGHHYPVFKTSLHLRGEQFAVNRKIQSAIDTLLNAIAVQYLWNLGLYYGNKTLILKEEYEKLQLLIIIIRH